MNFNKASVLIGIISLLNTLTLNIYCQDFKYQRFDRQLAVRPTGSIACKNLDTSNLNIIYSVLFDFIEDSLHLKGIDTIPPDYNEFYQVSQISDRYGHLAARFTGRYLSDRYGNETDLAPFFNYSLNDNRFCADNSMILPNPNKVDSFILVFLTDLKYDNIYKVSAPEAISLAYFHLTSDKKIQVDKVIPLFSTGKYLVDGGVSACRHANGRDWWVIAPTRHSSVLNIFIFTPNGFYFSHAFDTGIRLLDPNKAIRFSPKGNYFLLGTTENLDPPKMYLKDAHIQIFKFDRCNGTFYDNIDFYFPQEDTNCCNSPLVDLNERYIYVPTCNAIWQGDLWSDEVSASFIKVCEADYSIEDNSFFHTISNGFHGPDGKMYFQDYRDSYRMTVINYPERGGLACDARYAGIIKPGCTGASTGNMPYYGLGPLDGSPCDTLGLDGPLSKKPEQAHNPPLMVSPNPGTGFFFVQLPSQGGLLSVYNLNGMLVHSERISDFRMVAEINLAAGVYIVQFLSRDGSIRSGAKVVSR